MKLYERYEGGTIIVDHTASPGLPEDIAVAAGYDPKLCQEGKKYEAATLTCAHCKCAVVKNQFRIRPRETCPKCNYRYICDFCFAETQKPLYQHMQFEKLADTLQDLAEHGVALGTPQELLSLPGKL